MNEVDSIGGGHTSWNHLPKVAPAVARSVDWRDAISSALANRGPLKVLAYGNGRTYGDVCLNPGNLILPARGLNRILAYDRERKARVARGARETR